MRLEQEKNSTLLWWIIGGIFLLIGLYVAYKQFTTPQNLPVAKPQAVVTAKPAAQTPPATVEPVEASAAVSESQPVTLVDDNLLKAPVPENATLAKDEMAKLNDVQKQLHEQQATLTEQHQDADQLIKLKEEQIKLLEAQLAQQQ